ncbi:hypothetical protein BLNAU_8726 [Blattamonas nauphoetae]|uniref:Uncharacterized protein n=1 Tax=Blattamonas nauphoetae TaxID=2049346 RepID=A0ABQ9XY25_9EUKA|nr:hypothetical protein BLNAU_8726 [Blattamonas nauphoetae]
MTLPTNGSVGSSMTSELSILSGDLSPSASNCPPSWNLSKISSLLERLKYDDEKIIIHTLRELQKVASESLFFEPAIVDSLYLRYKDIIISQFMKIGNLSPLPAGVTTLARISLSHHLIIASKSLKALYNVAKRNLTTLTHLPSPIFPSSFPHQQYSGHSFLDALVFKLRIVFSEFQRNIPIDPSHLPKYTQLTTDDPFFIPDSISFCSYSWYLPLRLLLATPRIEVDSEIIRDLILFVKEALPTILANISNIDTLIASLPSDSTPTTSMTIILDDPSFPDLILNSLKLIHSVYRESTLTVITNIVVEFPRMRESFMTANLVGRMFETVDFVSLPLSESETIFQVTEFIACMLSPIGDDKDAQYDQYPHIRTSVFKPARQFITFIIHNSDKLILDEDDKASLNDRLCWIHRHINNMELQSDEHDADILSALVKWETRTMVEMENETRLWLVFQTLWSRTFAWIRNKPERQKRREVLLNEEGWEDACELQNVGREFATNQTLWVSWKGIRVELAFNLDEL